jgi:alanine-synthesizing transaminase
VKGLGIAKGARPPGQALTSAKDHSPVSIGKLDFDETWFTQSSKLQDVLYEIRGPGARTRARLEAEGHRILKLNIGNPAPFGFEAPDEIMRDIIQATCPTRRATRTPRASCRPAARWCTRYELVDGFPRFDVDDVYLGNGVSELIQMTLQALLDNGDEVLIPAPDYPLWTASHLAGRRHAGALPVRRDAGLACPIADDIESKITDRTKAIVVINPNNPTGAVYSRELLEADGRSRAQAQLAAASGRRDLRQDPLRRRQAHRDGIGGARPALPDLQRAVQGLPGGRLPVRLAGDHRPQGARRELHRGHHLLANMRLCPNVPAQHAIQVALGGHQSIEDLVLPGGRLLEQRDVAGPSSTRSPGCRA